MQVKLKGERNKTILFILNLFLLSRDHYKQVSSSAFLIFFFTFFTFQIHVDSLFWKEISACVAVHTSYVMIVCDYVQSIILLPAMMWTWFMPVTLTGLIISELKHWVTWSHRAGINLPSFGGGEESNTWVFLLNHIYLNSFLLVVQITFEKWKFLFPFKLKIFSYQICSLMRNLELIGFWWIIKETFLF